MSPEEKAMLGIPVRYLLKHPIHGLIDIASDPIQVLMTMQDYYIERRERSRPRCQYQSDENWERRVHERLSIAWPCESRAEFCDLWPVVMKQLAQNGIDAGPETFKWWNDGDAGLVRAIWCLIRHLKPKRIVETGVAHGVSSRFILEALKINGDGHLWSIDLPPLERTLHPEIGVAVGRGHADRWTFIRGSSRRRLPKLLSDLGQIDMFIHDSLHSEQNVLFELDRSGRYLAPNGVIVVDDIDANGGFQSFTEESSIQPIIGDAEPARPDARRFNNKGQFGIILNAPLKGKDLLGSRADFSRLNSN
jgi:predicted O-methyltransferase YrrM